MMQIVLTGPFAPYELPPDKLAQALQLSKIYDITDYCGPIWTTIALLFALRFRWFARLRDWTQSVTARWWLQGLIFSPLFIPLLMLIFLPPQILIHQAKVTYGLSIQPWPSWFADQAKSLLPAIVVGSLLMLLGFALIRRSPKLWWLWFWLLTMPVSVFTQFISPVLIAPMYNHFEPLSNANPVLVDNMEQVIAKSGLSIPRSRIYVMNASVNSTVLNAYVAGFGSSRRVVVYDTLIARMPTDQVLFVFAHELGHAAFNHVVKGIIFSSLLLVVQFFLGRICATWLIQRFGARWHIDNFGDWAAAGVLALVFTVFSFLSEPVQNGFYRLQEHHADIYGMEAVHGLISDPQQTAANVQQTFGENTFDPPHESPLVIFWSYTHPSATDRKHFAATYNPWQPGRHPSYFPEDKTH